MKPLKNYVVVEEVESLKQSSGILLKESLDTPSYKVVAVGPDVEQLKIGDIVYWKDNSLMEINGQFIGEESDVVAKI